MSTLTKKMTPQEIRALYTRIKPLSKSEKKPDWTLWQLKTSDCTITAYQSGKVVFAGADLSWLEDDTPSQSTGQNSLADTFPQAGSDEVGTGDYFGPVVVAACIVENKEQAAALKAMKITDSKAMSDEVILKVAKKIEDMLPCSVQVLMPEHYNRIYDKTAMNINRIKARMHNQAYLNLEKKGYELPKLKVIDQFCPPATYARHLQGVAQVVPDMHFETKAESKYIAVAAASVLARYAFLQAWEKMEEHWDFQFSKGGGAQADKSGRLFLKSHPQSDLVHVAKLHFANTKKITS